MPPQQNHGLLDLVGQGKNIGAHNLLLGVRCKI